MGKARAPGRVKLVVGLISNNTALFDKIRSILKKTFKNPVDFESAVLDFTHTDYYNEEMGSALKRKFLSFKKTISLKNIEKIKLMTNEIERKNSVSTKRRINIDPGYLDLSKLVLFSTKDYSHRIHVGRGIFAEVTMVYKDKKFRPWPWTYPDYRTEDYILIFNKIRELYKNDYAQIHTD
jgi:hypothetical protein